MHPLKKLAALVALIPICAFCQASDERLYVGLKYGQIKTDTSSSPMRGITLGAGIARGFSAELNVLKGDLECCRGYYEYEYQNSGLFLAYRTGDRIYRMAKIGVIQVDADGERFKRVSGGIGLGVRLNNNLSIEGEIKKLEGSLKFFGLTARLSVL